MRASVRRLVRVGGLTGVLVGQVVYASRRRDLPALTNQDPSGDFGDPALPRLRIAVLGDSAVTAPGVEPLDDAWPRRIALRYADTHHVELRSFARGGARAANVLAHQVDAAIAARPDIAIVFVGANDAMRGTPVAHYEAALDAILDRLTAAVPAVGAVGVGDLGTIPRIPTLLRAVATVRARAIDRAARRSVARHPGVLKVVTWGPQWSEWYSPDTSALFAADMFHPSAMGHASYARGFALLVDALVESLGIDTAAAGETQPTS